MKIRGNGGEGREDVDVEQGNVDEGGEDVEQEVAHGNDALD